MCELSFTGNIKNIRKTSIKDKVVFDILLDNQSVYFHIVCKDDVLEKLLDETNVDDYIFAKGEVKSKQLAINKLVTECFYMRPVILSINGIKTYQIRSSQEIDEAGRKSRETNLERIRGLSEFLRQHKFTIADKQKKYDKAKSRESYTDRINRVGSLISGKGRDKKKGC